MLVLFLAAISLGSLSLSAMYIISKQVHSVGMPVWQKRMASCDLARHQLAFMISIASKQH